MARSNLFSDALIWKMLKYISEFIVEAFSAKVNKHSQINECMNILQAIEVKFIL